MPSGLLKDALESGWLRVEESTDAPLTALLSRTPDLGEAEAISLAETARKGDVLIIDETAGRAVARSLGVQVVGTLGILLRAKLQGSVRSVGAEMSKLSNEAGFFMSQAIQDQILRAAGEL